MLQFFFPIYDLGFAEKCLWQVKEIDGNGVTVGKNGIINPAQHEKESITDEKFESISSTDEDEQLYFERTT